MFQMQIQNSRLKISESLQHFSKLKKDSKCHEMELGEIYGVPVIQSDCSDDDDCQSTNLQSIKAKLQRFKRQKAMEVVKMHKETNQSIETIVSLLKDQFSYEALCVIDSKFKSSAEKKSKQLQEGGSTLPCSEQRKQERETPGFDFQTTNGKQIDINIDLREFTLGQKDEEPSSHQTQNYHIDDELFVTEFHTCARKSTKNIKNKIMMKKGQ